MMQLCKMMDYCYVSRAMIEFSEATISDLVRAYHFNQTFSSSWKFSVCRDCFLFFRFLSHHRHCNKFARYLNALEEAWRVDLYLIKIEKLTMNHWLRDACRKYDMFLEGLSLTLFTLQTKTKRKKKFLLYHNIRDLLTR